MKKLFLTLLVMFVLYVIYYDLKVGVLQETTSTSFENQNEEAASSINIKKQEELEKEMLNYSQKDHLYYREVQVTSGQTVLSIVEQLHNGPIPVSIAQLIADFQQLNPETEPERIQIGKKYKFPVYNAPE